MASNTDTIAQLESDRDRLYAAVQRSERTAEMYAARGDEQGAQQERQITTAYYRGYQAIEGKLRKLIAEYESDQTTAQQAIEHEAITVVRDRIERICPDRAQVIALAAIRVLYGTRSDLWPKHLQDTYLMILSESKT